MTESIDRRSFVLQGGAAVLGLSGLRRESPLHGRVPMTDRPVVAVMGVNSRGNELATAFARVGADVAWVCDVDSRSVEKTVAAVRALQEHSPLGITDFRRALDDPALDALIIAAPDHWHAPATLLGLQAGKHVYVEKPCGHNPREGELLVEAQRRYGRVVQMGTQQRSAPESIDIVRQIRNGIIGRPYFARAWYANTRGSIGRGSPAPVPDWLDYELWQGPAPRTPFHDNVVHYNWHWFRRWGTGEICNNGTHEIDVCRWALGVGYPSKVTSAGGRYHFDDDWEFPDTQVATFEFENGATISWEGMSCNGRPTENRGRGAAIHGTQGTAVIDRSGYVVYDLENHEVVRRIRGETADPLDIRGEGVLTDLHIANFLDAIRGSATPAAPIDEGHKSQLLCHLGNIAQRTGHALHCDPQTGRIVDDAEAAALWAREYEPGWEAKV
jgi:predicted dehydrogenase